jgi:hypothetical protein
MTLELFAAMEPELRPAEIKKHQDWLATLNTQELTEVGRLLCHASPRKMREEYPIIGDLPTKQRVAQEAYESQFFGDENGNTLTNSKRGDMPTE